MGRLAVRRRLAPPDDAAVRRVVVAGLAGAVLTAPLSAQQILGATPALGAAVSCAGAVMAVACCRWTWLPSRALTSFAAVLCLAFATSTLTIGAGQLAAALRASARSLDCQDDVSASVSGGASAVLQGINPYTGFDIPATERSLGCSTYRVTPLHAGRFAHAAAPPSDAALQPLARSVAAGARTDSLVTSFTYPAGTALLGILGAHGLVLATVLALATAAALLVATSAPPARPWLALALLAQTGALVLIGPERPDGVVAALLVIACARRHPLLDGLALGLACAIKQTAWFLAPPLLILGLRRNRRAGLREGAAALAVFLLVDVPFAAPSPLTWLHDVLVPLTAPVFPTGGGLESLVAPLVPTPLVLAGPLSAVAVASVLAGCVLAWRGRGAWAQAGVIVAGLALWDGPRGLLFYLGVLGPVTVAVCAATLARRSPAPLPAARAPARLSPG